jgi:hypothetical protein
MKVIYVGKVTKIGLNEGERPLEKRGVNTKLILNGSLMTRVSLWLRLISLTVGLSDRIFENK